ncbi:hypothetical protein [Streptomyces sp.]|uniref:hypothetical protein n=1 Tax=Streptomyces sp. TaxID=1931 RepID=UPI0039C95535
MSAASLGTPGTIRSGSAGPLVRLRRLLALDAAVTGVNGLAYLVLSGPLGRLLGVDTGLLAGLGAFLLLYGVGSGWRRAAPTRPPSGRASWSRATCCGRWRAPRPWSPARWTRPRRGGCGSRSGRWWSPPSRPAGT